MKILITALLVFLMSSLAFAQSRIVSIDAFDLSYTGGLSIKQDSAKGSDRDQSNFRVNLNYAQNLDQYVGLMWKAQIHANRQHTDWGSSDTLESTFGVAGGVIYNLNGEDVKNSIMMSGVIGIERGAYEYNGKDDKSGMNVFMALEGGKRWDLGHYSVANISYAPTVLLTLKRYGGAVRDDYFQSSRELRINFLKFDILF